MKTYEVIKEQYPAQLVRRLNELSRQGFVIDKMAVGPNEVWIIMVKEVTEVENGTNGAKSSTSNN